MHAIFRTGLILAVLALAAGAVGAASAPSADAQYFAWARNCITEMNADLPAITASAEVAAGHFVHDNWDLATWGESWFCDEMSGRAGGLMPLTVLKAPGSGANKVIVLYCPREAQLADDWVAIQAFHAHGDLVIAFTRPEIVAAAARAGVTFDAVVDNHAAEHGGLFPVTAGGKTTWVVPTDPVANLVGVWTWSGEFAAACTRLGKMPTFWQSVRVPGSSQRNALYRPLRYDPKTPLPVAGGQVGRQYLSSLRWEMDTLDRLESEHIAAAGQEAHDAHAAGHAAYAAVFGHVFLHLLGCPHDPGYLTMILQGWTHLRKDVTLQRGDFILGIGYDSPLGGPTYENLAEKARAAGCVLAGSFTDYQTDAIAALPAGEIFINQRWELGDALVQLPGYDIKILPPSGVLAQLVLWMSEAKYWELERPAAPQ